MPSASDRWLDGAVDVHVHCAPSPVPRWGSGLDVIQAASAAGMSGVVLKAHHGSTVGAAAVLSEAQTAIEVVGGIVLNHFVGGLNPAAVDAALRTGGRCVWFPTVHSVDHTRAFGSAAPYEARARISRLDGLCVLDSAGRIKEEAGEILALLAEHDAVLATGHLSWPEIDALVSAAALARVSRVLINHPLFPTPGLSVDAAVELAGRGAMLEVTYLAVSPSWRSASVTSYANLIRRAGADAIVASSDGGQPENPSPAEGLGTLAEMLAQAGVSPADVRRVITTNPRRLMFS